MNEPSETIDMADQTPALPMLARPDELPSGGEQWPPARLEHASDIDEVKPSAAWLQVADPTQMDDAPPAVEQIEETPASSFESAPSPRRSYANTTSGRRWQIVFATAICATIVVALTVWILEANDIAIWPRDESNPDWHKIIYRRFPANNSSSALMYSERIPESDAKRLGDFLNNQGYFDGSVPVTVWCNRQDDAFVISFFIRKDVTITEELAERFESLRMRISEEIFSDQRVVVELCEPLIFPTGGPPRFNVRRRLD